MNKPVIGFVGIGLMGLPMAGNLLEAGFPLIAWNRTASKAESLIPQGAQVADTLKILTEKADIVVLMLENGPIVDRLLRTEIAPVLRSGQLVIDMGSIPPEMAREHASLCKAVGAGYLDAPVSGGTVGAEQATLSIMAGGERNCFEKAQSVFSALGKKSTFIGPAGSGQLAKCANQAIVGITIGAVSEAMLLAAAGGADPSAVRAALLGGFADSRILDLHGQRMIERNFEPGATSRVQLKDLTTILDTAADSDLTLPLTEAVYAQYQDLIRHGDENVDHSGLLLQLERINKPARVGKAHDSRPPVVEAS